jgi:ricin-type beta-trefoil lectin protein
MRRIFRRLGGGGAVVLGMFFLAGAPAQAGLLAAGTDAGPHGYDLPPGVTDLCVAGAPGTATCAGLLYSPTGSIPDKDHGHAGGKVSPETTPPGFTPTQVQSSYGFPSASAGSGETVAVVSAYDDPTAASDLAAYRTQYSLPECGTGTGIAGSACFQKVSQTGSTTVLPGPDGGWAATDSESLDMISAVCPNCHIVLVEAMGSDISDLGAAENEAVALGAKFIDNTWLDSEQTLGSKKESQADSEYFDQPGIAITAPSGNAGYTDDVNYPAASPYVTAVGGTTLATDSTGIRGWTETAWALSSSGCSQYEPKPDWQMDSGCTDRTLNDLAALANPTPGIATYDSYEDQDDNPWITTGGTAAGSAIVAAAYALAGIPAANTNPASYPYLNPGGSYTTPGNAYPYPAGLNDITSGSTGTCSPSPSYLCNAGDGYDGPTGLGSPSGSAALTDTGGLTGSVYSGEPDMCMDDTTDTQHNGTKIQIYSCTTQSASKDDPSQDWTIEANGTIQLTSSYCLDAENGGPDIQLYECNGDLNQQWVPQSNGTIENPNSGQCLVDPSGSTTNGTQLQLATCSATATDEQWIIPYPVPTATGNIQSQLASTNICLDDTNGGTSPGNPIQIYQCLTGSGGTDQQWTVAPDGTLQIFGSCMATVKNGITNGTAVGLYGCTGDTNQRWTQTSAGTLVNTLSGKCLDDPSASTKNGTQLQIWSCNGDPQQNWVLP